METAAFVLTEIKTVLHRSGDPLRAESHTTEIRRDSRRIHYRDVFVVIQLHKHRAAMSLLSRKSKVLNNRPVPNIY